MKIREIILDFTSLLDIIMIILFFFILFSNLETQTAIDTAEQKQKEYSELAEETKKEQSEWREQADKEWSRIQTIDKNAVENQKALLEFDNGEVISMNLPDIESGDDFTLSVTANNKRVAKIKWTDEENFRKELTEIFKNCGLDSNKVIISALTYDGYSLGTGKAVPRIEDAVKEIQDEYDNLYFTTINTSR